jgi:hypothetical protein
MSGMDSVTVIVIVGVALVAIWLASLFFRAPRGYENTKGFGLDRRKIGDRSGTPADRREASAADAGRVRSTDAAVKPIRQDARKTDR